MTTADITILRSALNAIVSGTTDRGVIWLDDNDEGLVDSDGAYSCSLDQADKIAARAQVAGLHLNINTAA